MQTRWHPKIELFLQRREHCWWTFETTRRKRNKKKNIHLRGIIFYTCSQWEFTGCFDIIPSETRQAKKNMGTHTLITTKKNLLFNFARDTLLTLVSRLLWFPKNLQIVGAVSCVIVQLQKGHHQNVDPKKIELTISHKITSKKKGGTMSVVFTTITITTAISFWEWCLSLPFFSSKLSLRSFVTVIQPIALIFKHEQHTKRLMTQQLSNIRTDFQFFCYVTPPCLVFYNNTDNTIPFYICGTSPRPWYQYISSA